MFVISFSSFAYIAYNKKDLYPRRDYAQWIKVLLAIYIVSRSEPYGCVDGPGINHVSG
jgi:hypothetical protein